MLPDGRRSRDGSTSPAASPILFVVREEVLIAPMTLATANAEPIVRAIHALRDRFDKPVRMEDLASIAHLSP